MTSAEPKRTIKWKLLLGLGLGGLALGAFQLHVSGPVRDQDQSNRKRIAELNRQLDLVNTEIAAAGALKMRTQEVQADLDRWSRERPAASVLVWFSERVKAHFSRVATSEPATRMNTTVKDPDMPGFERAYFRVEVPIPQTERSVPEMMQAVVDFEQQDPFVKILDFGVRTNPENPGQQIAGFNVAVLSRK